MKNAQPVQFGNFGDSFHNRDTAKVVLLPVPYDGTSTYVKGADKGPAAIIEASHQVEGYDIETDTEPYRAGIYTERPVAENSSPQEMAEAVYEKTKGLIDESKFVITIGGEHSVSIGAIKAYTEKFKELSVLQLDAHSDLRSEYEGSKYNHACVMARVRELCPFVQVGIRSMDSSEKKFMDTDRVFFAEEIYNSSRRSVPQPDDRSYIDKVSERLTGDVYITIDLDVFDPSVMPSTGTPEPGGLFWYDVLALLKTVFGKTNVVGFDVVELCPNENNKAPDFTAAKLIYKMLAYKFAPHLLCPS